MWKPIHRKTANDKSVVSRFSFTFHISMSFCGRLDTSDNIVFDTFHKLNKFPECFRIQNYLPPFCLWKISHISFPSTFQFVEDFHTFLFLPHFSLWKISILFFSFHISVCRRFLNRRLNYPNKLHMWLSLKENEDIQWSNQYCDKLAGTYTSDFLQAWFSQHGIAPQHSTSLLLRKKQSCLGTLNSKQFFSFLKVQ